MIRYGGNLPRLLYPSQAVARSNVTDETLADARAILAGRTAAGGGPVPAMLTPGPKRLFPERPPLATKPLDPDPAPTVNGSKVTAPSGGDALAGGSGGDAMGSGGPEAGGGLWDWLKADAYGADDNPLAAAALGKEGTPGRASRLDALGDTLLGAAKGYQQGLMSGVKGAGIGGAFIGAAEGLDASRAQDQAMLRQQVADVIALKKAGNTDTSEFERLLNDPNLSAEQKAALKQSRLNSLASETRQVTYREPTPEERAQGIISVGSNGEKKFMPSEYVTSEAERERLRITAEGNAATQSLAAAQFAAIQAQRGSENSAREDAAKLAEANRQQQDRDTLRGEATTKSPAISQARQAAPYLTAIENAAKVPGTMSDLDLVYSVAKIFDPTSVVRETEAGMVIENSSGTVLPAIITQTLNKAQDGQGITDEMRRKIVNTAKTRVKSYLEAAKPEVEYYTNLAKKRGYDPEDVIPFLPAMPVIDPETPEATVYGAAPPKAPPPVLTLTPEARAKAQARIAPPAAPAPPKAADPTEDFVNSLWGMPQ